MKKVLLFAAMFAFAAITFTSCGGGETATTEPTADTVATEVPVAEPVAVDTLALGDAVHGEEIYNQVCMACHNAGVAGAAKLTDKARWEASAAKGAATIKEHTVKGFTGEHGVMPPKGGRVDLTDADMNDAVAYIFKTAGVELK